MTGGPRLLYSAALTESSCGIYASAGRCNNQCYSALLGLHAPALNGCSPPCAAEGLRYPSYCAVVASQPGGKTTLVFLKKLSWMSGLRANSGLAKLLGAAKASLRVRQQHQHEEAW